MPSRGFPSMVIVPLSASVTPASRFRSVDFPHPMKPTIETTSPRSTVNDTRSSTCRDGEPNDFESPCASMKAITVREASLPPRPSSDRAESDHAYRQDCQNMDVRVDQAVVFLPQEAAGRPAFRSASRLRR